MALLETFGKDELKEEASMQDKVESTSAGKKPKLETSKWPLWSQLIVVAGVLALLVFTYLETGRIDLVGTFGSAIPVTIISSLFAWIFKMLFRKKVHQAFNKSFAVVFFLMAVFILMGSF